MATKLSDAELKQGLSELPGWSLTNGMIVKTYEHASFPEAIVFVNAVAHLAELLNHHPDIDIRYSNISIALVTHDAGGVTVKDVTLAKQIEAIRKKVGASS